MKKINIIINGVSKSFSSVKKDLFMDILRNYILKDPNIAVALNYEIVLKRDWNKVILKHNDVLEIVTPFPGG